MANYIEALNQGFAAAKEAEIARKEIREVLDNLKSEIVKASDGKLLVEVRKVEEPEEDVSKTVISRYYGALQPKKYYKAVIATNPKATKQIDKQLAIWKQSKEGYPCSLIWGKKEHQCEDRSALEECLAELLRDPLVGEQLYQLTKMI